MPGVLDLWVADQGSRNGAVPPWPLLTEGTTDYFKGVPVAVFQRGGQMIGLVGHAAVISPAQPRGLITGHAGQ